MVLDLATFFQYVETEMGMSGLRERKTLLFFIIIISGAVIKFPLKLHKSILHILTWPPFDGSV
jgi:hypothetical protein